MKSRVDRELMSRLATSKYDSIRIRPELRAAQVKRSSLMTPALTLYFDEKYDLGATSLRESFVKVNFLTCAMILAISKATILEVPEPLWLRFAAKNLILISVWKLFGLFRRNRRITVTYAIENNDLAALTSIRDRPVFVLQRLFRLLAGAAIRASIDRIVFGSYASQELYYSLRGVRSIPNKLIEELPAKALSGHDRGYLRPGANEAIFVGELDDRKGIRDLMEAWPSVESDLPDAIITVVGGGELESKVRQWCEDRPTSRVYLGLVPHEDTLSHLGQASVLIAPSRRAGRWREQIGLPIVEALSLGTTVVTTDETGLATWLLEHGHVVIPEPRLGEILPRAITAALKSPLDRQAVVGVLPSIPGRIMADSWLHAAKTPGSAEVN
ncbi:glycosyltransferase family 4 protein [Arthrobacter bambusae]